MTVFKAKTIATDIMNDIKIDYNNIIKDYLETKEFKALVEEEVERRERLQIVANEMGELISNKDKKTSRITLDGLEFSYSEEDDYWNLGIYQNNPSIMVENNLGFHSWRKLNYIHDKVLAIIVCLDDISIDTVKEIVKNTINLKEIMFNKDI